MNLKNQYPNDLQTIRTLHPGTEVTDSERTGRIVKKSKDEARALVRFEDGMTEWTEYYRIEKTRKP